MSSTPKTTLWIWPTGLFPRRLIYYFRLKHITLSTLTSHSIHLIPVALTVSPPSLSSLPGHESRPPNTSLPIMRITHPSGREVWIRESLSILEYFESLFLPLSGFPNLLDANLEQRAQTGDILSLLNDAMHWSLISLINSDPQTMFWSGLKEEDMSKSTAEHAEGKWQFYLERLEQWVQDDSGAVVKRETLAGLVLLAQVEYHQMMYGADWIEGHGVLREWVERMKKKEWYVASQVLKGVEKGEGWETLLGGRG